MNSVCVLMATYNGSKYLREQIDSLIRQVGVVVTILVRDDGSSDNTTVILQEYKEKGLLDWYSNGHKNVQKGFLDLCKKAPKADFYAFCDQDDVWDEDKLKIATDYLSGKDQEIPLLYYCGQKLVDENLQLMSVHKVSDKRSAHTNYLISNVAGCTMVFNKRLLDAVNSCDPDFILMHDSWVFKVCLALGGEYVVDPEAHINYRQHGNNTVGLKGGLKSKLHQMKRYITVFEIQRQLQNLYANYSTEMTPEYLSLTEQICNYDKSFANWMKMLFSKDFDFKNGSLNLTVKLKVLLRKL